MRSWDDELRASTTTVKQVLHEWYEGIQEALQNRVHGSWPEFIKPRLGAQEAWVREWVKMITSHYDTEQDRTARAICVIMMECYEIELDKKNLSIPFVPVKLRYALTRELDAEAAAQRMQLTDSDLFRRLAKQVDYPFNGYLKILKPALLVREALIIKLNEVAPLCQSEEEVSAEDVARIMAQLESGVDPYS